MTNPLPDWCTPHTVTVRALTGSGGMGNTYAAPVTVPAFVNEGATLVRDADAQEVVSSAQVHVDWDVAAPAGSLVTLWAGTSREREATVITTSGSTHPTLPAFQTLALT